MWWAALASASLTVLGDPAFRAPDGVGRVRVASDGSPWVISAQGQITGFDREGRVTGDFQACPDRGVHADFWIDPRGTRAVVPCGGRLRVFELPMGRLLFEKAVFASDVAFSRDGLHLAVAGERIVDGVSESTSHLLRYHPTTGADGPVQEAAWDALFAVSGGWVGATTTDDGLVVEGEFSLGTRLIRWSWTAPSDLRTTEDWGPHEAVAVLDAGKRVCVQLDFGGVCLDGRTGATVTRWAVPAEARTEAMRAEPHGDGFVVGESLWFVRDGEPHAWVSGGQPVKQATGQVPVASPSGRHRYLVTASGLQPVGAAGDPWSRAESVDLSRDGGLLALADERGRVVVQRVGAEPRVLDVRAERVALSPDGSELWAFDGARAARVELASGAVRRGPWPAVGFDRSGRAWTVEPGEERWLLRESDDGLERVLELPRGLEVTGIEVTGDPANARVLLEYAQDDAWQIARPTGVGPLKSQSLLDRADLILLDGGAIGTTETDDGWKVGDATVPYRSTVRFVPDGTGYLVVADDGRAVEVRSYPDGAVARTVELPGRVHGLWTRGDRAIASLKDGRLVLFGL